MKYIRTNGAAREYQPGGPDDDDPWWHEVVMYLCVAATLFGILYGGVAVSRWMS